MIKITTLQSRRNNSMLHDKKIVVVLPAYNAAKTLEKTYNEIPFDIVDDIVLVDDNSPDDTIKVAENLGIKHIIKHQKNRGYGGNQKTCYAHALALGADATFVGRTMDRDPKHMQIMIARAEQHQGTSFLEIYQNCNIFNDGAFEVFTEKSTKQVHGLYVEQGKPLTFGANAEMGIRFDGIRPEVVEIGSKYSADDMWIHDEKDFYKAQILTRLFDNPSEVGAVFPRPFGVFYTNDRPCYEQMMSLQIEEALAKGAGDLDKLIRGKETWEIK